MNDLDWKKPALIGGLIAGIFAAVPGISLLNACCCGWSLIGGAVAAKMVIGTSQRPVKSGEGAQIGLMAGLVCAVAFVAISMPIILSGVAVDLSMSMLDMMASRSGDPRLLEMIQAAREQAVRQVAQRIEAERLELLRRVAMDLTGLPPTVERAEAYARDTRPDAYERAVDELLASPAFGEHWARAWLDLARYADSTGYAEDNPREIWGYRDWVIRALNDIDYGGPLSVEWEDIRMDRVHGATEAAAFVRKGHEIRDRGAIRPWR